MSVIVALLLLTPREAATTMELLGLIDRAHPLHWICRRESHCQRLSVHERDRWASKPAYLKAVAVGQIDPNCTDPSDDWSTRGAFGLLAAYNAKYLPRCSPPWVFDVPLVSAYVAAKRYRARCVLDEVGHAWCPW